MISYIAYNSYVLVAIYFAYLYERISSRASFSIKVFLIFFSFLSLFLLSALRFDVGPDYETYVQIYNNIIDGLINVTLDKYTFGVISTSFSSFYRGYVFVFAVYSFLTLLFVFNVLVKRNILLWGLLIFCCVGFYLDSLDRIRQLLAVVIFLYAISFIENKKPIQYVFAIIFAALFHFSAILLLPVYFYNRLNIKSSVLILVLVCLFCLHLFGITGSVQSFIYTHIPYYSKIYGDSEFVNVQGGFGSGLGFLFNLLLIFYLLFSMKDNHVIKNLVFTAGFIMLLAPGNLNIMRFSQYFYISLAIGFPIAICSGSYVKYKKVISFILLIIFFQAQQGRNNYTYQTIFSDNFKQEKFLLRASERPLTNQSK